MAEKVELTEDGNLRIIGKQPSEELLAQIKDRIGPDEAAVAVSAETIHQFLGKK